MPGLKTCSRVGPQEVHRNDQRFRVGLVFKAHRLCVSLNSRLESNKEEEEILDKTPHLHPRPHTHPKTRIWRELACWLVAQPSNSAAHRDKGREWNVSKQKWNLR